MVLLNLLFGIAFTEPRIASIRDFEKGHKLKVNGNYIGAVCSVAQALAC